MYQLYRDRPLLVLGMLLANLALSTWCLYLDPVINNDGVTYFAIAQMFLDGHWSSAFDYYSWPFYPLFIAVTAKLFFIDVETAAYLLNALFVISLTLAFTCIVSELSNNNRRIILIAMVVILFFPSITKYRSFIIRDFGYLSCYLWSLYFIFRFCSTLQKQHLIGWLLFAVLSCLFRFEGIAFLLIAPYFLVLFTAARMPHRRAILSSLSAGILLVSIAILYWYVTDKYNALIEMSRANGNDISGLSDLFFINVEQQFGKNANYFSVFAINLWNVLYELIRRMAVFYFAFSIYAYLSINVFQDRLMRRIWLVFVITNLVVLIGFSLFNNFLVSRYTMATALTLLLLAPFAINQLWDRLKDAKLAKRISLIFMLVLLAAASLEGLDVRTNKTNIKAAGLWLKNNAEPDASLYSNNRLIIHYSGLESKTILNRLFSTGQMWFFIKTNQIRSFDYIALESNNKVKIEDTARQTLAYKYGRPVKIIEGQNDSAVFIFKITSDQ